MWAEHGNIYFFEGTYIMWNSSIWMSNSFKICITQFFTNNKEKTQVVMLNDVHGSFFYVTSKDSEFYLQQTEK